MESTAKPLLITKPSPDTIHWSWNGKLCLELDGLCFKAHDPIWEKALLNACKAHSVRVTVEEYTTGPKGYCVTITGLKKIIHLLKGKN